MFGRGIKLFSIFGFEIKVDLSWLIILTLVVWSLAGAFFPARYRDYPAGVYLAMGFGGAFGLFFSIVFHELTHSLVARVFKLPIKGITLFIFGGVSEMTDEPPSPKAEFFMALAGPLSSLFLSAVFYGLAALGSAARWPVPVVGVLAWIAVINLLLGIFNLIPGFPMDGGRVLRSILWRLKGNLPWATRIASYAGSAFGFLLIGLGILSLLMGNPIGGLWWILIGFFIHSAARQGYQQVLIRQALQGEPVSRFMTHEAVSVPPDINLASLVDDYVYRYHYKMYPIVENDRLAGCISTSEIKQVPREEWASTPVSRVAAQCAADNTIGPREDAMAALAKMSRSQLSRLMVVDDGRLVGVISLKDLLKFLSLKLDLGDERPLTGTRAATGTGTHTLTRPPL